MAIYNPGEEDIIKNEILNKSGQDAVDAYYYLMRVSKNNNLSSNDRMKIGLEIADWYNTGYKTKTWDTILNEEFNKIGQGTGYDMPASMADDYNKLTSVTKAWQDKGGAFNQPTTPTNTTTSPTLTGWDKFYNDNKDAFQKAGIVSNLWNPDSAYQKAKKAYEVNPNNTNPDFNNQFLTNVIQTGKLPDGTLLSTPATEQVNNENLSPQEIAQKMRVAYEKSMQNIAQNPNKENIIQKYNIGDFKGSLRGGGTSIGNDNIPSPLPTGNTDFTTLPTTFKSESITVNGIQYYWDANTNKYILTPGQNVSELTSVPLQKTTDVVVVNGKKYAWMGNSYSIIPGQTDNTSLPPTISGSLEDAKKQGAQPTGAPNGDILEFSSIPTVKWGEKITVNGTPYAWMGNSYSIIPKTYNTPKLPDISSGGNDSPVNTGTGNTGSGGTILSKPPDNSFQKFGPGGTGNVAPGGTGLTSVPTTKTTETITVNGKKYAWMGNSYSIIPGQ